MDNNEKYHFNIFSKKTVILLAILAIVTLVVTIMVQNRGSKKPVALTYSQFVETVVAGKVSNVAFTATTSGVTMAAGAMKDGTTYTSNVPPGDYGLYAKLLTAGVSTVVSPARSNVLINVLQLIPTIAIILAMLYVVKNLGGGQNKALSFSKMNTNINMENTKVKFDDVIGQKEAKEDVSELIDYLKNPRKYSDMGAKIPNGTLLIGPPGCGKTLLAKAIAGEAKVPYFYVSGSEFVEMFVGVGASRVRSLFETAKKYAPCIIFVDEIDAVGRHRGAGIGGGNDEREQTLNQLLVEMDGFKDNSGILVLAATNRPDVLDPALLRPGRFDRHVMLNAPEECDRESLLKFYMKGKPVDESVNYAALGRETSGMTGADIEHLVNEAALLTVRRKLAKIGPPEVEEAIDKIVAGAQNRSRVVCEEEKKRIAYHEAGHAVVGKAISSTEDIHRVSIISRGDALGFTLHFQKEDRFMLTTKQMENEIAMLMGGRAAEQLFLGSISTGASNDLARASGIARKMVTEYGMSPIGNIVYERAGDADTIDRNPNAIGYSEATAKDIDAYASKYVDDSFAEAQKILEKWRLQVENLAALLLERETLQGEELDVALAPIVEEVAA